MIEHFTEVFEFDQHTVMCHLPFRWPFPFPLCRFDCNLLNLISSGNSYAEFQSARHKCVDVRCRSDHSSNCLSRGKRRKKKNENVKIEAFFDPSSMCHHNVVSLILFDSSFSDFVSIFTPKHFALPASSSLYAAWHDGHFSTHTYITHTYARSLFYGHVKVQLLFFSFFIFIFYDYYHLPFRCLR